MLRLSCGVVNILKATTYAVKLSAKWPWNFIHRV
jgi:hypothetical protein